jgi:nucleoside-triphosphatase THEP1
MMEVKIDVTGPQGCGKTTLIEDIEDLLVLEFGRCAVQSKDWNNDDHAVTFTIDTDSK